MFLCKWMTIKVIVRSAYRPTRRLELQYKLLIRESTRPYSEREWRQGWTALDLSCFPRLGFCRLQDLPADRTFSVDYKHWPTSSRDNELTRRRMLATYPTCAWNFATFKIISVFDIMPNNFRCPSIGSLTVTFCDHSMFSKRCKWFSPIPYRIF